MKALTLILTTAFLLTGNLIGQTFSRITTGDIVNDEGNSYGMGWGDCDGDGFIVLFVTNSDGENNYLYRNLGDGQFTRVLSTGELVNGGGPGAGSV